MKFTIKPYDPIDEAIQNFVKFNENPQDSEHTEDELVRMAVHTINNHDATA
jgi:hypothetical protein